MFEGGGEEERGGGGLGRDSGSEGVMNERMECRERVVTLFMSEWIDGMRRGGGWRRGGGGCPASFYNLTRFSWHRMFCPFSCSACSSHRAPALTTSQNLGNTKTKDDIFSYFQKMKKKIFKEEVKSRGRHLWSGLVR